MIVSSSFGTTRHPVHRAVSIARNAAMGVIVASAMVACTRAAPRQPLPPMKPQPVASMQALARAPIPLPASGTVQIDGRAHGPTFTVEVATTERERNQGLMYRLVLGTGKGMVFFMPRDYDWAFYMRNTRIPLDIIFIDATWRVVGVAANVPPMTETLRSVGAPSRYVLELDAHEAKRHGIQAGTTLRFQPMSRAP